MRRAAKVDANQAEIVKALRQVGQVFNRLLQLAKVVQIYW